MIVLAFFLVHVMCGNFYLPTHNTFILINENETEGLVSKYCIMQTILMIPEDYQVDTTGVRVKDAHFAFLAFQLFLMLSTSLDMTHMQYN